MPYSNVPKALWPKMEACTAAVKKRGVTGDSIYKICYAQVVGQGVAHEAKKRKEAMK